MTRQSLVHLFLTGIAVAAVAKAEDTVVAPPVPAPPVPVFQTAPGPPRDNRLISVFSKDEVRVTWSNKRRDRLSYGLLGRERELLTIANWAVAAGGEALSHSQVGHAYVFQTEANLRGPAHPDYGFPIAGMVMIVPDNKSHLPLAREFDAVQAITIPADSYDDYFKFTFENGKGTISSMNYRSTGYGTAWKKEYRRNDRAIVEYYVQIADTNASPVADTGRFKILRNPVNRHTIRLHTDNTSEQAMPGDTEWRPFDEGEWTFRR